MGVKEDTIKTLEHIKDILYAPIINVLLFAGLIFVAFSFCQLNISKAVKDFHILACPNIGMLLTGAIFVIISLLLFWFKGDFTVTKLNVKKGVILKFKGIEISIRVGKIEDISENGKHIGIVLPANASFDDECITDARSALGSFVLQHFPDKISNLKISIDKELTDAGYQKNTNNSNYNLGTTIILPEPYTKPANIIITAATTKIKNVGIRSNPSILIECIKNMFTVTADRKISAIYMPILGSGHGGLEINFALFSLISDIWYFSKEFCHIKKVNIIVIEEDAKKLKNINAFNCLNKLE